jgi:hypothetical protein
MAQLDTNSREGGLARVTAMQELTKYTATLNETLAYPPHQFGMH